MNNNNDDGEQATLNLSYNLIYLTYKLIQTTVFGPLSEEEFKAVQTNTWSFVFYRLVFMAAVLDTDLRELAVWMTWFALIAFVKAFVVLCKERLNTVMLIFFFVLFSHYYVIAYK